MWSVLVKGKQQASGGWKKSSLSYRKDLFFRLCLFLPFTVSNMPGAELPENVELLRTRVVLERDRVFSVS